ncbi:hypothetical protein [Candidatus Nitrosocosmicus franklandus]|uniref:Uncharacterized protein n=1 Tax=Candidatus Nitrosocosmicus franklandianus TaxID=1798806 RepID=A0A484IC70_9ARCH|nr:hypothetical protein [Candidatus Nitrosocosmicus franklandus]VFJ13260.1 conserved protein of unknown function [Candidatus Nitrosocosmicus franklandus]
MSTSNPIEIFSNSLGRKFILNILSFDNGYFIAISENESRLGSISVSLSVTNKPTTAKVIPDKNDQLFIDTLSTRISLMKNGICIVSLHTKSKLHLDDMKLINEKILAVIEEK